MKKINIESLLGQTIYIGIDVHKKTFHVTIRSFDCELSSQSIPASWSALKKLLNPFKSLEMKVVYEAGYCGYWLSRHLSHWGVDCLVTPPSLIPQESGNRVKTDRKDSKKLAFYLSRDLLKSVYVPSEANLQQRKLIRHRRQLMGNRVRVQNRIKAELSFHGQKLSSDQGSWTQSFLLELTNLAQSDSRFGLSMQMLLEEFHFLQEQILRLTQAIRQLAKSPQHQLNVQFLRSIPGVGLLTAMTFLLELEDLTRFAQSDQIAAYVGLTPSQFSSSDQIRMGHITRSGKADLRGMLVEAAWTLVRKDPYFKTKYQRLACRIGGKRAIVAIARKLVILARRLILDQTPYQPPVLQVV